MAFPNRRRVLGSIGWIAVGLLVFVIPMSVFSEITRGSLSYSGQSYLYSVYKDSDVLRNGYGKAIPTASEFIRPESRFCGRGDTGERSRLCRADPTEIAGCCRWRQPGSA